MTNTDTIIWNTLRNAGFSATSVAGIMGNMFCESGMRADIDEYGGGGGYGLVQWTPKSKLVSWAVSQGLAPGSVPTQLARIIWEVENNEQFYRVDQTFRQWVESDSTPEDKAAEFARYYERPAFLNVYERGQAARRFFDKYAYSASQDAPRALFYDDSHVTGPRDTRKLQSLLGVTVDGIAGVETITALCAHFGYQSDNISGQLLDVLSHWPTLRCVVYGGEGSPTVRRLQALINTTVDGLWGPRTADALERWFDAGCVGW